MKFRELLFPAILLGILNAAWVAHAAERKPNIVFILADDLGWKDVGCNGSTFYETPNIDKLAAEGIRFTQAYAACPVCSPTRASIMTGKYPARLKLTDYIPGARKGKLLPAEYLHYLPLEEATIAEALKEGGYTTCFAGKWHLGGPKYWPEHQGFDVNIGGTDAGAPSSYFSPYRNARLSDGPKGEYLTDRLTDEALKFVDANAARPFFLYLAHYAVHNPQQGKKELIAKYAAKAAALPPPGGPKFLPEGEHLTRQIQDMPVYAAMIDSVDDSVGRVMKKLDELGIADNTIVFFFSDNGGLSTAEGSPTSNAPLRAGKGWLYEGGIREPLIVKWPHAIKPGATSAQPVVSTDFYPTILEMAGLPAKPEQHCDGVSIVPLLKDGRELERKNLFWHYPHYGNQGGSPGSAVRSGDYKLIRFYEDKHAELYNVKDDLSEKTDLTAKLPDKVKELEALLDNWLRDTQAAFPKPNPNYKPGKPKLENVELPKED